VSQAHRLRIGEVMGVKEAGWGGGGVAEVEEAMSSAVSFFLWVILDNLRFFSIIYGGVYFPWHSLSCFVTCCFTVRFR
jgi:hypothetical protein